MCVLCACVRVYVCGCVHECAFLCIAVKNERTAKFAFSVLFCLYFQRTNIDQSNTGGIKLIKLIECHLTPLLKAVNRI